MDTLSGRGPLLLGIGAAVLAVTVLFASAFANNGEVSVIVVIAAILCPALLAFQLGWRMGAERESRW